MDTAFERNWEDLPPELVHLFAKKLPDICDFIHLRAVCKTWRSAISISDQPPQFPWIMKESNGPDLKFYSMHPSNKVYTIHAPNSSDKYVQGPAGGYVLALAHQDGNTAHLSLMNPINNSEVCLPVLDASHSEIHWISSPSFQSNDYVVIMDGNCTLYACKVGDDKWDCIKLDCIGHWNCWEGLYYLKKSLLFMAERSQAWVTKVMDIGSHEELYVIPPPEDENSSECYPYIFECGEDILRVCGYFKLNSDAAFDKERGITGLGMVIRGSDGDLITAKALPVFTNLDTLRGEALAVLEGVKLARILGLQRIHIETDSQQFCTLFYAADSAFCSIGTIITDIKEACQDFVDWKLSHVFREKNVIAHDVASYVLLHTSPLGWNNSDFISFVRSLLVTGPPA